MPSVNITQTLRDIIKEERKKRKISTVSLSELIGRGKAYISQIESGKISAIDLSTFYNIFEKLIDMPDAERNEYIRTNILDQTTINLSKDEIKKQEWLITFDMKIRQFPIDENLRKLIQEKRNIIGKTSEELVSYINENNDLKNKDEYEQNQLLVKISPNGTIEESIRFHFPIDFTEKIETGHLNTISYIDMQGVLYNLFRLEKKNIVDSIEEAKIILKSNGFLTLSERNETRKNNYQKMLDSNENFNYYDLEPTELEKEHAKILEEIIGGFHFMRDKNIVYSHKQISQLLLNMKPDLGFMYAILGSEFDKIGAMDFKTKKKFILDMKELIKSYLPDSELHLEDSKVQD